MFVTKVTGASNVVDERENWNLSMPWAGGVANAVIGLTSRPLSFIISIRSKRGFSWISVRYPIAAGRQY